MSRAERIDIGNEMYHVINRANARQTLFRTDKDYQLFESILTDAKEFFDMRILAYSVNKGTPLGAGEWLTRLATRFDLAATMRGVGRPRKE